MEIEFYQEVVSLFNRFLDEVDEKMHREMRWKGDVILQAPQFIIDILFQAVRATNAIKPAWNPDPTGLSVFRGLKIQPTYEMAIILFHKHYPLYREDWMLKKIALEPPQTLQKEWYSITVVKMKEFYGMGGSNPADN
jgi:hypothetical protein